MTERFLVAVGLCVLCGGCNGAVRASSPSAPGLFPSAVVQPVGVVPGVAVGPIRLGMRRAEVEDLRVLRRHPHGSMTVPYQVVYDETDRVAFAQVSLLRAPGDVRVEGALLPRGTTLSRARDLLGDCSEPDIGSGGGSVACRSGRIEVMGGSGSPDDIWIGTHPVR